MAGRETIFAEVGTYGTDAVGENITIELRLEPEDRSMLLTIPYNRIWLLVDAIRSAATLAVQAQQRVPAHQMAAVSPYVAQSVHVGHYPATGRIALHFQATEGIPLAVAMSRPVAETTIALFQSELDGPPEHSHKLS
jgi:hypothetical protein